MDIVSRPQAKQVVQEIIESPPEGLYDVLTGPHCTGKSTLVLKIAAENPGVIYICTLNVESKNIGRYLTKKLAKAILWRPLRTSLILLSSWCLARW